METLIGRWLAVGLLGLTCACGAEEVGADMTPTRAGAGAEMQPGVEMQAGTGVEPEPVMEPEPGALYELFAYDWTAEPGVEAYFCGYQTLTEDLYIDQFRPLMPPGTHHVTVGYQDPARPDGYVPADPTVGMPTPEVCTGVSFGDVFSFAATVGTQDLSMPEGVAVKIPAGKQLVFGLHVMNTGSDPIRGRSGVQVRSPERSAVTHEAEVVAAQNVSFEVPPGRSTVEATCTMADDVTVFAVLPHMHLAGVHLKATAGPPGAPTSTLLDSDYAFDDQRYRLIDPMVPLQRGDQINVTCEYMNPGTETLMTGESTGGNEMCIAFVYRFPALLTDDVPIDTSLGFGAPRSWCIQ